MFAQILFYFVTSAFAGNQNQTMQPSRAALEIPFYAVADAEIARARCRQDRAPSTDQMTQWLLAKALREDARKNATGQIARESVQDSVFGVHISKDSPYLVGLLETLLKKEPLSNETQKNYSSLCDSVFCAAEDLFGERVGIQLLFMLSKYGFNGADQRMKSADRWTREELDEVLLALSDLPAHLAARPEKLMNHPLVHFDRKDTSSQRPLANAIIYVYNVWNQQVPSLRRYSLFHELGHNMSLDFDFDGGNKWSQAAGWEEKDYEWIAKHPETKISQYAASNPDEDFAESFSAYRYGPARLKKINPRIYQFMKTKVFRNIEYLSERTCSNPH